MKEYMKSIKCKTWSELMPTAPPVAIDLISKLITWNPKKRLTAK